MRTGRLYLNINTQKKELVQYPAILTSHLVNNPDIVNGSLCNLCAVAPGLALHIFTIQCLWVQRSPQKMRKKWQRRSTPNQTIVDFCRESLGKCPLKYIIKRVLRMRATGHGVTLCNDIKKNLGPPTHSIDPTVTSWLCELCWRCSQTDGGIEPPQFSKRKQS